MRNPHRSRTRVLVPVVAGMLGAALLAATPGRAGAQCGGDCNGDGEVTVDEIITMVNIALGAAALPACPAADGNGDGQVAIDDIIGAVNNALSGCPAGPTPTPPPTAPATPTPTWTPWPKCGDGTLDFALGETCDDGNLVEGDECPSNCRIRECRIDGTTVEVDFSFEAPPGVPINGLSIFIRYQEDRVRLPGRRDSPISLGRISNTPEVAFFQHNNLEYGLRMAYSSLDPDNLLIEPGQLLTVTFDNCIGAPPLTLGDFACRVLDGSSPGGIPVDGATMRCYATAIRR